MDRRRHLGYRGLNVWKQAFALAKETYRLTEAFPKHQQFALTSQMQRAAISIPSNIAEGYNRKSVKEYSQFLSIAHGSLGELETQLLLALDLGYADPAKTESMLAILSELNRMLHGMIYKPQPSTMDKSG